MNDTVTAILERARWAPSGDNEQPWTFERVAADRVVVHGYDTRHECVYDLDGSASQVALGALIETIVVAASVHGLRVEAKRSEEAGVETPLIVVTFTPDQAVVSDPIEACIETRSVYRRALSTRSITSYQKTRLESAVGERFGVVWRDGRKARLRMAVLLFQSAKIRLVMPEAYRVHRDAIEWNATTSEDGVPEAAVGLDPLTAGLMRWVMRRWSRVQFFNRFLAGTWVPRIQLDFVPAVACAGHFFLVAASEKDDIDAHIAAGRALQRFWLTAASLGLQLQPEATPLIFARYARKGVTFSLTRGMSEAAARIANRLEREIGAGALGRVMFMGRVGMGAASKARSVRLPLTRLMLDAFAARKAQKLRRTSA